MASLPGTTIQTSNNNFNNNNSSSLTNYLSNNYCSSTESVSTATTITTKAEIMDEPIVKQPETANHLPSPIKSPAKVTFCGESLNEPLNTRLSSNRITTIE